MANLESLKPNGHSTMLVTLFQKMKQKLDTKVDKVIGKGLSSEDYTPSEKTKLAGIENGAQANTVTSVAGKTGAVTLSSSDVGLGNVGNFKAVSTVANQGLTDTEKSNARDNIGAGTSSFSGSYNDLTNTPLTPVYVPNVLLKTGTDDQSRISLGELMQWLFTKQYIRSNVYCYTIMQTTWSYANSDILRLSIDGQNYELQLAGVFIEFMGAATNSTTGRFRLRIHSSPTVSFPVTSGYEHFPTSHIVEYTCNGPSYNPNWKMVTGNRNSFYGTCETESATAAKVVTISYTTGWNLRPGTIIGVKFTYTNTASNVTLNVNNTGAKQIRFANAAYSGTAAEVTGYANYVIYYMYDGTYWNFFNINNNYRDTNNYVTQTNSTDNYDFRVLFSQTADDVTRTQGARKSEKLKFNPSTGTLTTPSTITKTALQKTVATSANISANGVPGVSHIFVDSTSTTTGLPNVEGSGHIINLSSDSTTTGGAQLYIDTSNPSFPRLLIRCQTSSGSWGNWLQAPTWNHDLMSGEYTNIMDKGYTVKLSGVSGQLAYTTPQSIEISASGEAPDYYFNLPSDKNLWQGKKILICAWKTSENDADTNPPKFMWEFYCANGLTGNSDDFDIYSSYRRDMGTLSETYITMYFDYTNNRLYFQDTGIYARNLNGGSFYLYWYHSLMTYKLIILN